MQRQLTEEPFSGKYLLSKMKIYLLILIAFTSCNSKPESSKKDNTSKQITSNKVVSSPIEKRAVQSINNDTLVIKLKQLHYELLDISSSSNLEKRVLVIMRNKVVKGRIKL